MLQNGQLLFGKLLHLIAVFDLIYKDFCRFKTGDIMLINNQCCVARNVARNLLLTLLINETAKATDVNVISVGHGILHNAEKGFHRGCYISFIDSGLFSYFVDYVCFGHGDVFWY